MIKYSDTDLYRNTVSKNIQPVAGEQMEQKTSLGRSGSSAKNGCWRDDLAMPKDWLVSTLPKLRMVVRKDSKRKSARWRSA
jgi:hypothetical protein